MPIGKWRPASPPYKTSAELLAQFFATQAHDGAVRKYTGEPYVVHPATVAEIVRGVPHTEDMLCAAWLHDVVEDTPTTIQQIAARFGWGVADLVEMLTHPTHPSAWPRVRWNVANLQHLAQAAPAAKTIRLADIIDNVRDVVQHDPVFARRYLVEKQQALEVLREGDLALQTWAHELIKIQVQALQHG